jgi:hypothetical protein
MEDGQKSGHRARRLHSCYLRGVPIIESCYRYVRKLDAENVEVPNWLIRLTDNHRNWSFGLCYFYLRNVKGFKWKCIRVYQFSRSWI